MRSLTHAAQVYVCAVIVAAIAVVGFAPWSGRVSWPPVLVLAVTYWLCDSRSVSTGIARMSVSAGFPVALASVLLVGPWGAALICAVYVFTFGQHAPWFKRAFNGAQSALSAFGAAVVYARCPGAAGAGFSHAHFPGVLISVTVAGFVYFGLNTIFVVQVIHLTTATPLWAVLRGALDEMAITILGSGSIGLIMAVLWAGGVGPVAALLVLVPLLVARWAFQQYGDQHQAYEATVASLIRAVETKDCYTRGHSERVAKASVLIAQEMNMSQDRLEMLRYAGMLHDVGKLGVPTKVLQKTGPLDDIELASVRLHPERGFEIVKGIEFLDESVLGVRHHHERIDGLGYPDGLAGDQIPEFARVIAVADAFDSMTSTRSYRGARTVDVALVELQQWSGSQFDPVMVDALVAAVTRSGWQPYIDVTDQYVDRGGLIVCDHDDPAVHRQASRNPDANVIAERVF